MLTRRAAVESGLVRPKFIDGEAGLLGAVDDTGMKPAERGMSAPPVRGVVGRDVGERHEVLVSASGVTSE